MLPMTYLILAIVLVAAVQYLLHIYFCIPFVISTDTGDLVYRHLKPTGETILCITSGGDNPLDFALNGARAVLCCDYNPVQNHLLELKMAAIKECPYDVYWQLFGKGTYPSFRRGVYPSLRPHLSDDARRFWDARRSYFQHGLYNVGSLQLFVSRFLLAPIADSCIRPIMEQCGAAGRACTRLYRTFRPFERLTTLLTTSKMGVSTAQWSGGSSITRNLLHGLRQRSTNVCRDYVTRLYMTGSFTPTLCPQHIKADAFPLLRERVANIRIVPGDMTQALRQVDRVDRIVFLDHLDVLDHAAVVEEMVEVERVTRHLVAGTVCGLFKSVDRPPRYLAAIESFFVVRDISAELRDDGSDIYMVQYCGTIARR